MPPTNLVSDRSARAADENPVTDSRLDIPYSPGEFIFKTYDQPERERSEPGGREKPDDGMGDIAAVDLMGEGDQDRHYQFQPGPGTSATSRPAWSGRAE